MKTSFLAKMLSLVTVAAMALMVGGCYDDQPIQDRLADHEARLQALEKLCNEMNTNISSIQQIVTALQNNDFVTDIAPITENGEEIGYTISFSKSGAVTIYHGVDGKDGSNGKDGVDGTNGKDGTDGATPVVGLKQEVDGIWYWTLNGEWLRDEAGAKVKAVGIDGKDGKDGTNGQDGKDGTNGQDGTNGKDGQNGKDGTNGQDGKDGIDGVTPQLKIEADYWYVSYDEGKTWTKLGKATGKDGKDGQDGKNGVDGQNGQNGRNGQDGTSFFRSVTQDDKAVYLVLSNGTTITLPKTRPLDVTFDVIGTSLSVKPNEVLDITYTVVSESNDVKVEVVSSADVRAILIPTNMLTGTLRIKATAGVDEFSKVTLFVSDGVSLLMKTFTFSTVVADLTNDFPDANFRALIANDYDGNHDGFLTPDEYVQVTDLVFDTSNIASLEGIEFFPNLVRLEARGGYEWDDQNNKAVYTGKLTSVDLSGNPGLKTVYLYQNNLTQLNVSNNPELTELSVQNNYLSSLDLSSCARLKQLYVYENQLASLDLSHNSKLTHLECNDNALTKLDLSGNPALTGLFVGSNPFTTLPDFSNMTQLTALGCDDLGLTSLDLTKLTDLIQLSCNGNPLSSTPDFSKNTKLEKIFLSGCGLTTLNVSALTKLRELDFSYNNLTTLDLTPNTALQFIWYWENPSLTTLYLNAGQDYKQLSGTVVPTYL